MRLYAVVDGDDAGVAVPPKRDIRGLRTPAEGMSVARMVVIRCFGVSAFRRFGVSLFRRLGVWGVSASRFLRGEIVRIRFR